MRFSLPWACSSARCPIRAVRLLAKWALSTAGPSAGRRGRTTHRSDSDAPSTPSERAMYQESATPRRVTSSRQPQELRGQPLYAFCAHAPTLHHAHGTLSMVAHLYNTAPAPLGPGLPLDPPSNCITYVADPDRVGGSTLSLANVLIARGDRRTLSRDEPSPLLPVRLLVLLRLLLVRCLARVEAFPERSVSAAGVK